MAIVNRAASRAAAETRLRISVASAALLRLLQKIGERVRMAGLAEVEPLHFVATVVAQEFVLRRRFDTLGYDAHAERLAERHDGFRDRGIVGAVRDVAHERPIDLQRIDRKALEL